MQQVRSVSYREALRIRRKKGHRHGAAERIIYTNLGCPYCAAAKRDLEGQGKPYEEISTENNTSAIEEVKRLSDGTGIVPILVEGDKVKVGFGGG